MAAPTVRTAAQAFLSSSGTSLTITKPTGTVEGDVLFAEVTVNGDQTVTPPAGWTAVTTSQSGSASDDVKVQTFRKTAGASEPANYSFTQVDSGRMCGGIVALVGAEPVPHVTGSGNGGAAGSVNVVGPTVTTTAADTLLVGVYAVREDVTFTPAAGMTEWVDVAASGLASEVAVETVAAAGATGTRTAVASGDNRWAATHVVFSALNHPPNAPTLTSPVGGAAVDRAATVTFDGGFSDADEDDELSASQVEYRPTGGATVDLGQQAASGATFAETVAGGTLAAGTYEWRARTWDALGLVGAWSGWAQFSAIDEPAAPVITAPADEGTIDTDPYTVEWTAPSQDAYQVRTVADLAGSPDTGTVYTDTGTVESAGARSRSVTFATNNRTEHVQVRVRYAGLWSDWASHEADVSWVAPAEPSATVAAHPSAAALTVSWVHPAPAGAEPDVAETRVWRRERDDDTDDWSEPIRRATALTFGDGSWDDWAVAHRVTYDYQVEAVALSGTSAMSDWAVAGAVEEGVTLDGGSP